MMYYEQDLTMVATAFIVVGMGMALAVYFEKRGK